MQLQRALEGIIVVSSVLFASFIMASPRPVRVHVYDISGGMARAMSQQLIGTYLEYVPHTGVVVDGTEYFFGGGIQAAPASRVPSIIGLRPVEVIDIGHTTRTLSEIRLFLRAAAPRFTPATYHLLRWNCNHFSAELLAYLVPGVTLPDRITRVPEIVLRTPMGAMLMQMLGGVESRLEEAQGASHGASFDPFAGLGALESVQSDAAAVTALASAPATPAEASPQTAQVARSESVVVASSALQTQPRPLLSREPGGDIRVFAERIIRHATASATVRMTPAELASLEALPSLLLLQPTEASGDSGSCSSHDSLSADGGHSNDERVTTLAAAACAAARALYLMSDSESASIAALGLLRRLVLYKPAVAALVQASEADGGFAVVLNACGTMPPASKIGTLSLAVLTNAFATPAGITWMAEPVVRSRLVDCVLRGMRTPRVELRRLVMAIALSFAITERPGAASSDSDTVPLPDCTTTLLCALVNDARDEGNDECLRLRLLAAGHIAIRYRAGVDLLAAIDAEDVLRAVVSDTSRAAEVRSLAAELKAVIVA